MRTSERKAPSDRRAVRACSSIAQRIETSRTDAAETGRFQTADTSWSIVTMYSYTAKAEDAIKGVHLIIMIFTHQTEPSECEVGGV